MVKEVFAYLETHWDREWYKTFEEYRLRLCDVLEDVFEKLENKEIKVFYLDGQTIALDDYLEIYPEKLEYVKNLIKQKKLFVGPFYDLADEFLVNGESLIRNLLIGINEAKKYGADKNDFIGYLPDAFGHCQWMPMLFKKSGIDKALVWRGVVSENQEFLWQSPDKSIVKTVLLPMGYYQDFFAKKSYTKNVSKLLEKLEIFTDKNMPILLSIGADHLACEDNIKGKFKNFNRINKNFNIKLSSLKEYFEKTKNNKNLEVISGEFRNNQNSYILPSVFSSRIYLKQNNMLCQWLLGRITEPLYAILNSKGLIDSKKENIDYIWKLLIQNHAHDSICGCSLDEVHSENEMRYKKVKQICLALIDSVKAKLSKSISKNELGIMNLSNFEYSGVTSFYSDKKLPLPIVSKQKKFPIEISQDMHNIPVQEDYRYYYEYLTNVENIRGLGFKTINHKIIHSEFFKADNSFIENEFLKIHINKNGTFNLKNKMKNIEFSNLFNITDEADVGDSYNFSCILDDKPIYAKFTTSKLVEDNELRKKLRLKYEMLIPSHAKNETQRSKKLLKHEFVVELILTSTAKRLDIKIEYENFSKDHILKLNFPLQNSIDKTVSEDVFGTIERTYKKDYDYKKLLPMEKYKEVDLNINSFQRFVMTQNLCILTKGLQEYEIYKNNINITLLRSFGCIAKKTLLTRTAAAGPPLPTDEGQCIGRHVAELSLCISDDTKEIFKEADFYYNPFVVIDGKAKQTTIKDFQFADISDNLYLYNIKETEDKNGVGFKIFNISDEAVRFENKNEFIETNLLEENKSKMQKTMLIQPNELKILKIQK